MELPLFVGDLCLVPLMLVSNLCPSSFAIILMMKRELAALLKLSSWCIVNVSVMLLSLAVPWVVCRKSLWCFLIILTCFLKQMRLRSPKSNKLLPHSQQCIHASSVKIYLFILDLRRYADADSYGIRTKTNGHPTGIHGTV